ncbi:MAG: isoprenylcysteine carboxylmethyltransferase family protein [Deltaproteobacteria bacterium]|nr:isoprenylcysteine carboxylmethyltransferase family protein [Deltaproteobacteria bacterium]
MVDNAVMEPDSITVYRLLVAHAAAAFAIHGGFILARPGWSRRLVEGSEGVSFYLIIGGIAAFYASLFLCLISPESVAAFSWPFSWWLFIPGCALLALQLLFMFAAHLSLGRSWSGSVFTYDGQELVTTGIYAHVSHPIYAGVVFWAAGALLTGHNALFLTLVPAAVGVVIRIRAEERHLQDRFGDAWTRHRKKTRTFL